MFLPGLVWQAALIKSEQYGILYLLAAALFLELSMLQDFDRKLLLGLAGLCAGLALVTKVQSLFLVLILLTRLVRPHNSKKLSLAFPILNSVLFLALLAAADRFEVTAPTAGAAGYGLNSFSILMSLLILLPVLLLFSL